MVFLVANQKRELVNKDERATKKIKLEVKFKFNANKILGAIADLGDGEASDV